MDCQLTAFCTGSSGRFRLRFLRGLRDEEAVKAAEFKLRLGVRLGVPARVAGEPQSECPSRAGELRREHPAVLVVAIVEDIDGCVAEAPGEQRERGRLVCVGRENAQESASPIRV